jgi:hypothetical protein
MNFSFKKTDGQSGSGKISEMTKAVELAHTDRWQKLKPFHGGTEWNERMFWARVQAGVHKQVEGIIEAGKALIVLKEMTEHGEFIQNLETAGLSKRTVQNYMALAARFSGFDKEFVKSMGSTKLYKMLSAPPEELDRLQESGEFFDIEKADLVQMSSRELQAAIKEAKEKAESDFQDERAKSQVLHTENKKLQDKVRKLEDKLAGEQAERPQFWVQGMAVLALMRNFTQHLMENELDWNDEDIEKPAAYISTSLQAEMDNIAAHLVGAGKAREDFIAARDAKLKEIENKGTLDLTALEDVE